MISVLFLKMHERQATVGKHFKKFYIFSEHPAAFLKALASLELDLQSHPK